MTDLKQTYCDLMDSFSLSEKAKERIANAASSRIGEQRAHQLASSKNADESATTTSLASHKPSRRSFLAYGAAAVFAVFAVGVSTTGAFERLANALLGGSCPGDGNASTAWFALKAYADADPKTDVAMHGFSHETDVELGFFMPKTWTVNLATDRQTTYFQFDFTLVGDGVSSATFSFAHEGVLSLQGPVICGTDVGFAETVSRANLDMDDAKKPNAADAGEITTDSTKDSPALIVSEPRHMSSLTVAGNEAIGLFGTRSDDGITRTLFVQSTISPGFRCAFKRWSELSSEEDTPLPPETGATEETVEAYLLSMRGYQAREMQRKTEYAQLNAEMLYEIGRALSSRPLVITVNFQSGETASKRYRIAPLPKDVIAERLKPDENGNSGPGWNEWLGREPQAKPLFTVTELKSFN